MAALYPNIKVSITLGGILQSPSGIGSNNYVQDGAGNNSALKLNSNNINVKSATYGEFTITFTDNATLTCPDGKNISVKNLIATGNAEVTGDLLVDGDSTVNGSHTVGGDLNVNGNLIGNIVGNVTGNVTGNAATVTNGVYTTDNLSIFSATTSAQFASIISDATGTGSIVLNNSPTLITPTLGTINSGNLAAGTGYTAANVASNTRFVTGINIKKFTSSGTYTPTPGMIFCIIEVIGGGAGGGGCANSTYFGSGGGGGAGSYSRLMATATTISISQTVTIGTGGAGGTAGANNGTNGGDTSVGSLCIGKGGNAGAGATNDTQAIGGAGGIAGTGDITVIGSHGGASLASSATLTTAVNGGAGGTGYFGGGAGVTTNAQAGYSAPANTGSGGNGGNSQGAAGSFAGGAGGSGFVIITEYMAT